MRNKELRNVRRPNPGGPIDNPSTLEIPMDFG